MKSTLKPLVCLVAIGLLGASCLAAAVVPLSTSYAISEAVGVERSVSSRFRDAPLFLGLFTGQVIIGALIALLPGNLISLLINTQVDRKSTRLNSSHIPLSRMPSSA